MIRSRLLSTTACLLALLAVQAQTETEPNNSIGQANAMSEGVPMSGDMGSCTVTDNSQDHFELTTSGAGGLKIHSVMSNSGASTVPVTVQLLNSAGGFLQNIELDAGGGGVAVADSAIVDCRGEGLYYLRVIYPNGSDCIDYSLTYSILPPVFAQDAEPNNAIGQAVALPLATPLEGHINFQVYGDNTDHYRLDVPADGILNITVQAEHRGASDGTMILQLLNSAGAFLESFENATVGADSEPESTTFQSLCRGAGTYYLRVQNAPCGTSYQLEYSITSPLYAADEEDNDNTAQADTVPAGTLQEGRLNFHYDDNFDYYRLVLPDDGILSIEVDAEHAGPSDDDSLTVELLNNSGAFLTNWKVGVGANGIPNTQLISVNCRGNENHYFLRMQNSTACGTSYRFSYSVTPPLYADDLEPNDNLGQADTVVAGTEQEGRLNFIYDDNSDYYRLVLPDDGVLNIELHAEHVGPATDATLTATLLNNAGAFLQNWTADIGANGLPTMNALSIPCRGNEELYYLRIENSTACGTSYKFSYSVTPPVFGDDLESNQTLGTAIPFDPEASDASGRLNFFYDNNTDHFSISLPANGTITVNIEAENVGAAGTMNLVLLNSSGAFLQQQSMPVGGGSAPVQSSFTSNALNAGNYYFRLENAPCGTSYRLQCNDDDSDGTCNASDICADGPEPGSPCDDGDPNTANDTVNANCVCEGSTSPTENTALACADGIDNDGDGVADCDDPDCQAINNNLGCSTCFSDGLSFADTVIDYFNNCANNTSIDPSAALGVPDYDNTSATHVSLGNGGYVKLGFVNNTLTNSGTSAADLYVFEVGPQVEASTIELHPLDGSTETAVIAAGLVDSDADGFYEFGGIGGSTADVDIDAIVPGHPAGSLFFDAIKVVDAPGNCSTDTPGADIDAVCALSSLDCSIGAPCDDENACTTNDVYGPDCTCAGTPVDPDDNNACTIDSCDPVIGVINEPVDPDDGDPCTMDSCDPLTGVSNIFMDSDSDGTCDALDECPNDPEKTEPGICGCGNPEPGAACDDGDPDTENDVINANCVCEGTPIVTFDCPDLMANIGDSCDDNDPSTENDMVNANCVCEGTPIVTFDCPDLMANIGDSCDDNDPTTENDTVNANCVCEGTPIVIWDCPALEANIGDSCDDQDETTENDMVNANCVCEGTPIGEDDCLGVPGGTALPGTPCDDGNPNTDSDTWNANCECVGVQEGQTVLVLEVQTDDNGNETTWEILAQGTNTVVCSGGPYVSNSVITENCTVDNGCYLLRVYDSAGDGMSSGGTGGYILRPAGSDGERIIDNRYNFNGDFDGNVSALANNNGFCLPLGNDRVIQTSCDKLYWQNNEFIVASLNPLVSAEWINGAPNSQQDSDSGYEFWFFDPNGSYSFRWFRGHNTSHGFGSGPARAAHLRINNWLAAYHIPEDVLMNVRVRSRVNGVNSEWGPACRFQISPTLAACPPTKLMDITYNQYYSCGQTRSFATGSYVSANPVSGASQYQFRFRQPGEGFEVIRTSNTWHLQLWWTNDPLVPGTQYDVEVRAFRNGQWCVWGEVCTLTITEATGMHAGTLNSMKTTTTGAELNMWPNPNRGDQLFISLDEMPAGISTVTVDIFDLYGKRVSARAIPVNEGHFQTVLELNGELSAGLYMVNITVGDRVITERLVVQR